MNNYFYFILRNKNKLFYFKLHSINVIEKSLTQPTLIAWNVCSSSKENDKGGNENKVKS